MYKKADTIINADELMTGVVRNDSPFILDCIDQIHDLPDTSSLHRLSQLQSDMALGRYDLDEKLGDVAAAIACASSSPNDLRLI